MELNNEQLQDIERLADALEAKAKISNGEVMQAFLLCDLKDQMEWVANDDEINEWLETNQNYKRFV